MPAQTYDIFFSGRILEDTSLDEVKTKVGKLFNTSGEQLDYLFSGESVKIKNSIDQDTAIKYRVAFRNAGALVEIRSTGLEVPETSDNLEQTETEEGGMVLLPANSGSLIDCAPPVEPASIPDISGLSLAGPGTTLDETTPPPAAEIDTSELQLSPANTGTLEDCQQPKTPVPLPDISRLKLVD